MDLKTLRSKSIKELYEEAGKVRTDIYKTSLAGGTIEDTSVLRKKKKSLARILTVISEKEYLNTN
ncbi:50S ribosomal protein L29 [candidate division WWE3 bacterium CG08_land_8_20_14_0_20_43_13]|uniref:Large ribosomal subunit protein uL29 n=1 Tax=candidate division WWE3 bacterium CG08_land_8_20_14_0_20_43_13 TaxID=1975087 RepID=A0A2H0X9L0_UNCKA|nr:MAG: 50S ribosomal protein L29 [candidate division WWE3 bacterium CG08_land_8_20_14_0_20_43_13]